MPERCREGCKLGAETSIKLYAVVGSWASMDLLRLCTRFSALNKVVWSLESSKRVRLRELVLEAKKSCKARSKLFECLAATLVKASKRVAGVALDGGCGSGFMASALRSAGFRGLILCIDSSPAMAWVARRFSSCDDVVVADLNRVPLRSGCVSLALLGGVIHENDLRPLANEIGRVCRRGALLIAIDSATRGLPSKLQRVLRNLLHKKLRVAEVPHRLEDVEHALKLRGFANAALAVFSSTPITSRFVGVWIRK